MPSIEVLAEAAMNSDRRAAVIHVLESSVVSWMKQVKVISKADQCACVLCMEVIVLLNFPDGPTS